MDELRKLVDKWRLDGKQSRELSKQAQARGEEVMAVKLEQAAFDADSYAHELEAALVAIPAGDAMRGTIEVADFEENTLTFHMIGKYYAAAGEFLITPSPPLPANSGGNG